MTKYLLTGDGRRLLTGGGQVLTADAPGPAFSDITAAPIPVSIKLAAKVAAVAVATVAPMAMAFGLAASPKGSTGIKPMPVTFGLSASPSAWASAEVEPAAVEFGLAASPSATAKIVPAPAAAEFGLHASPSIAYPLAIRPQSMPVEMRLTAKPTRAAVIRPRPLTLTTTLSANISVSTAAKFLEKWLNVYGLRQAVLNAIDANNRELAKQAGDKATANAAAIVLTNSRVETAEGRITAEAERTTLLQGQVNDPATGLAANASGLGSLRTTVEQQGGQITAQSQDITKLRASVGATSGNLIGNAGFESDTFGWVIASDSLVGNVAESTYKLYRNRNGQRPGGINVLTWQSTATLSGGTVVVRSNSVPAVAGTRYCVQCAGDRQASSTLSFGIDFLNSSGGTISGGPSVVVPQGYVTESAFAVAPSGTVALRFWLRSQVTGSVSAPAFSVIRPMVSVAAAEQTTVPPWQPSASGVDEKYAQVTQLLSVEVNSLGQAKALWGMYLDVNGRVVGMQSINDGVRGEINFMADVFRLLSPAGADGMEIRDGYIRVWRGSVQRIIGNGFGAGGQLMDYFGPNVGVAAASKSNAIMYMDILGNAYWGGALSAGIIKNSAQTTVLTMNPTIEVGPFTTNGRPKQVTAGYSATSPTYTDYYPGRPESNPPPPPTISQPTTYLTISRRIDGNPSWTQISSTPISHGSTVVNAVYIPRDAFDPNLPNGGWKQDYYWSSSASVTYTDTQVGTANFSYAAAAGSPSYVKAGQVLSVLSTEE